MTIRIQPYESSDAERAVAFFAEAAATDSDLVPPTLADWHSYVGQTFQHGATDFAWAVDDGKTIALLMSSRYPEEGRELRHFRIIVLSSRRREGVGGLMLAHVVAQDPPGETILQANCHRSWKAGTRFLERNGFHASGDVLYMIAHDVPDAPAPTDRVRLRDHDGSDADDASWRRLHDDGYAGGRDYAPLGDDELDLLRARAGFQLRFAESDGAPIGFCHCHEYGGRIYINSLVLTAAWRGHGIGKLLLLDGIAGLRASGYEDVRLTVLSDNLPAAGLYRSVGFDTEDVSTTWRRE